MSKVIDFSGIERAMASLSVKDFALVGQRALNATAKKMKLTMAREIAAVSSIPVTKVKKGIRVLRSSTSRLESGIDTSGANLSISTTLKMKKVKGGVAYGMYGKRFVRQGAFIIKGRKFAAMRVDGVRGKIRAAVAPVSVSSVAKKNKIQQQIESESHSEIVKQFMLNYHKRNYWKKGKR
jgi:hypothetical protein